MNCANCKDLLSRLQQYLEFLDWRIAYGQETLALLPKAEDMSEISNLAVRGPVIRELAASSTNRVRFIYLFPEFKEAPITKFKGLL